MSEEKIAAVLKAAELAKSKGVTALKVELEAQFGRQDAPRSDDGRVAYSDCEDCDEDRMVICDVCDNHNCGEIDCTNSRTNCRTCNGTGHVPCTNCVPDEELVDSGVTNWGSEAACAGWLMRRIGEKTDTTFNEATLNSGGMYNPFSWMRFAKFYNDGSVDSELTFTIPLDDDENIMRLPKVLEAFKEMGEAINQSFDVRGAGMHMAFLFSPDATYPSNHDDYSTRDYGDSRRLPEARLRNFRRAMTQLLPALYFLASTDETSRALRYRMPYISMDFRNDRYIGNGAKYSAVTYRQGALEFRIFDTCYQEPEVVLDNFVVMSNCMEYMTDRFKSPGIDKLVKQLAFGTDHNNQLERFYMTEQHLDVLNNGLKKIKPSYLTLSDIKRKRKFTRTKEMLVNIMDEQKKKAEIAYKEYEDRFKWQIKSQELYVRSESINEVISNLTPTQIANLTDAELEKMVASRVATRVKALQGGKTRKDAYVNQLLRAFREQNIGQYQLNFS